MGMMLTINETAELLKARDDYLIITHRRPDGDTIGCAGALAQGLRGLGKTAFVLYNPETTSRYLPYIEAFWPTEDFIPREIITVDTASPGLFPENAMQYAERITLSIDHHPSNSDYAENTCLDSRCAACGEIVYEILTSLSDGICETAAACLYVALSTDTGCFAFANTTANTLRIAALTIEAGAPHREINRIMFRTRTRGRVMLEGLISSGIEFYYGGEVAVAAVTRELMERTGCTEDDIDDIASIPGSIEGVLVGITIRELTSAHDCKVSMRSSPRVNSNELCARFGGGGHPMAAGFSLETTIEDIKERLLAVLSESFPLEAD